MVARSREDSLYMGVDAALRGIKMTEGMDLESYTIRLPHYLPQCRIERVNDEIRNSRVFLFFCLGILWLRPRSLRRCAPGVLNVL